MSNSSPTRLRTYAPSSTLTVSPLRPGASLRAILRFLFWSAAIVVIAIGATLWWFVYRPLPQIDGNISLPGLQKEVTVERDNWGVPHIRATVEDIAEAQGYVMAQDRLWQMDLLRRVARGQLSEILGPVPLTLRGNFVPSVLPARRNAI